MRQGGFGLTGEFTGVAETVATMQGIDEKLRRKVTRKSLERASKPTLLAAKAGARKTKDSGLLARSIARKTATYQSGRRWSIVVILGPKRGMKQKVKRRGRKQQVMADPINYAHLVEYGTSGHSLDKGSRAPRSREHLDRARVASGKAVAKLQRAVQTLREELQGIENPTKRAAAEARLAKRSAALQRAVIRQQGLRASKARDEGFTPAGRRIHPGTRPHPFLRPAFDSTKAAAPALFAASARDMLTALVK
jgi:HK97 gp10 family phage protein